MIATQSGSFMQLPLVMQHLSASHASHAGLEGQGGTVQLAPPPEPPPPPPAPPASVAPAPLPPEPPLPDARDDEAAWEPVAASPPSSELQAPARSNNAGAERNTTASAVREQDARITVAPASKDRTARVAR